ncbi:MAG TPA: hypothetical protein PKY82_14770 [Pyrinomonadaceae bacterium]|nr:hypothetical protein [Pyrinomonadaceae bacterium]
MALKEKLKDWTDFDIAEYYLACSLGIVNCDETFDEFRRTKSIYASGNPLGNSLFEILEMLVKLGILERNESAGFRWNKNYKGYWE